MRVRWKCLALSVVFLAGALFTGYLLYDMSQPSNMVVAGGKAAMLSDEDFERLIGLVGSEYAAAARKKRQAKERKESLLFACALLAGCLGVAFLFSGFTFARPSPESHAREIEHDRPNAQT